MSPPRKSSPSDEEKLKRIHDLESDFYNVANAAGVVSDLLDSLFEGSQMTGIIPCDRADDLHLIDPGQLERFRYAVSDAWDKASKLKDDLNSALGYGAGA